MITTEKCERYVAGFEGNRISRTTVTILCEKRVCKYWPGAHIREGEYVHQLIWCGVRHCSATASKGSSNRSHPVTLCLSHWKWYLFACWGTRKGKWGRIWYDTIDQSMTSYYMILYESTQQISCIHRNIKWWYSLQHPYKISKLGYYSIESDFKN